MEVLSNGVNDARSGSEVILVVNSLFSRMAFDNYDFQPLLILVKPLIPALCEILRQIGTIDSGIYWSLGVFE